MMRSLCPLWFLALFVVPTSLSAASPEDAKLAAFFDAFLEARMKFSPSEATALGDHRYDDRLDDLSPAARAKADTHLRTSLEALPAIVEYAKLSRDAQIDFEILKSALTRQVWETDNFKPLENDPRAYNAVISDSVFLSLTQSTTAKALNVRNAAARIGYIPRVVEAARKTIGTPPAIFVETAIRQNRGSIAFYEKGIYELTGETPGISELSAPSKLAVVALKDYQAFLETEVLPRAKGDWRIGKARFAKKLEYELDTGIGADELLAEAAGEAERVRRDMYTIARQMWSATFPGKPVPPDDAVGRRQTIQVVLNELAKSTGDPKNLVRDIRGSVEEIKQFIRDKGILTLPEVDRCDVIEMPEFQRGTAAAYLNPAPPLDTRSRSVYAVSPPPSDWDTRRANSFMEEYNPTMLKILTIHEAYPGHYVQLEYGNRHPSKVRRVLYSGVFAEGWAVYTEQMMLDQGFGKGDLSLRLHQLKWYLRAVTNAILDHKMHCTDMTDGAALKMLTEEAFQSEGEAIGKIARAKLSSCQLSTYFAGRTAFYRLRTAVSREMGEKFDLKAYHENVLSHGTISVKYLPELVRRR